ncbi:hypothetical protein K505DRAFT_341299 [Melanomma pulvis-pyrius CBS 109.77]|uniref:PD-(D/E)XK nuclease-like domain-containing protein n=1 Tax=Melanomma pulvis-pyrius CBS 109.77 TaxID=1314802 RepID=A0A6A6WZN8_9PLEO|nr:hypothetical protein K505DRAFT_341299 [Melanomma pulvis-pyrius CBS 109.77]
MVDYAIHLEPSGPTRDIISPLIDMSTDSINPVGYEGLRSRPIAVSIETKTESRTVERWQDVASGAATDAGTDPDSHRRHGPGSLRYALTDCVSPHRHSIRSVVALLRPDHALQRSPPVEFGHSQTGVEYSDLPFGALGKRRIRCRHIGWSRA